MDKVAGSGYDEFYTPEYAITPILKYLKPKSIILCPFDTEQSNFVKLLTSVGHKVIFRHLNTKDDFFDLKPPMDNTKGNVSLSDVEGAVFVDYIISNPPYSKKNEVFEKLFELGIPFMMLVGVVGIFESQLRYNLFKDNDFEIMYMNKRISYFKNYDDQKPDVNPPFSSVYICKDILPKQIVFEEIKK